MVAQRTQSTASALALPLPSERHRVVPCRPKAPRVAGSPINRGPDLASALQLVAVAESLGVDTLAVGDEFGPWIAIGPEAPALFHRAQSGTLPGDSVVERWSMDGKDALLTARGEPTSLGPLTAELQTTAPARRPLMESGIFLRQTGAAVGSIDFGALDQAELDQIYPPREFDESAIVDFADEDPGDDSVLGYADVLECELEDFFLDPA